MTKFSCLFCALTVSSLSLIAASSYSLAKHPSQKFWVGSTFSGSHFYATTGYVSQHFSANIATSLIYVKDNIPHNNQTISFNEVPISINIGMRQKVSKSLFLTGGAHATYNFYGAMHRKLDNMTYNPYSMGSYVGIDWIATPHLIVSTQIAPIDYYDAGSAFREWRSFANGQISIGYIL